MGRNSAIQWCHSTWNPTSGCTKVSEGCRNCYAERIDTRFGRDFSDVVLHPDRLTRPLHWKKPQRIFVGSMSDLFHDRVPLPFILSILAIIRSAPQHTFMMLTKRAERMQEILSVFNQDLLPTLPNLWAGVSVEDQPTADRRIPIILRTNAAVRFVSYEPAIAAVKFGTWLYDGYNNGEHAPELDWIITGGESGPRARPSDPNWFRAVRDECQAAGVPFFFKQWGLWRPVRDQRHPHHPLHEFRDAKFGAPILVERAGIKESGRLLDGREWSEFPVSRA